MNLFSLSLILICPLIRLIQLQSLRFEFSIGCIENNIRTSLFPISFCPICASASDSLFLSLAFSLNSPFSFLLKVDMKIFPFGQSLQTFQILISFSSRQSPSNTWKWLITSHQFRALGQPTGAILGSWSLFRRDNFRCAFHRHNPFCAS